MPLEMPPWGRMLSAREHHAAKSGQQSHPAGTSHLDHSGYDLKAGICTALSHLSYLLSVLCPCWGHRERLCWGDTHLQCCCGLRGDLGNAVDKSVSELLVNRKLPNSFIIFLGFLGSFGLVLVAIIFAYLISGNTFF